MSRLLIATSILLLASSGEAQRAPYLQRGSPTEITVVWRDGAASGAVCYGTRASALTERVAAVAHAGQHEARLTGLRTATRYWYATTSGACPALADDNDTFRTAPEVGSAEPFRIWVVGDSGTGGAAQGRVRDAMLREVGASRPDLFVHVGDMAYSDGTDRQFTDNFFDVYAEVLRSTVCWPAIGNHEGHSADSGTETGPYYDSYVLPPDGAAGGLPSGTEAYYSFDYANVHFVVLDSHDSPRNPGGAMLTWLEDDLSSADAEWIVAYWHHPPYTKGSHDSDRESQLVDMRENALPILEAYGVDLVFGGHSHIYERSHLLRGAFDTPTTTPGHIVDPGDGRIDGDGAYDANAGTVYVVAGHGGTGVGGTGDHPVMFFSELANGSVIVDVNGPVLELRNVRTDGVITDTMTLLRRAEDALILLAPLGGEEVAAGDLLEVRWLAPTDTDALRVELSLDGGGSWSTMAEREDDDGSFAFVTPLVRTDRARIRIRDADRPEREAVSGEFALVATATEEAIPFGDVWEYHDTDIGPPGDWAETLGGWSEGPAQLGYGDGDEATLLLDADPNVPTVYFRQAIEVSGAVTRADFDLLYDDAIAVFVNGVQVYDIGIGDLVHSAYASDSSADNATASASVDGALFVTGQNVIAALVKQGGATSSDVSFDLRLQLILERDLPLPDAGPPDVGRPDGALADVGSEVGARDGAADAGDEGSSGCGCRAGSADPSPWLAVAALAFFVRRRRR